MDKVTQLENAIKFASQNPTDVRSIKLKEAISAGTYNNELAQIKAKNVQASQPEERNVVQKTLGAFLDPIIEGAVRTGQAIAGAGVEAFGSEETKDRFNKEVNKTIQVPITGTVIKPANELTTKNIAGNALGTVALGVGSPALGGAMIGASEGLKADASASETALDTVVGAVGGKVLEHGFNVVAPFIEKAVAKYGQPFLEKIAQYIPESAKGFMDDLVTKIPKFAESKILPEGASKTINTVNEKVSGAVNAPFQTIKSFKNVDDITKNINNDGELTKIVSDLKSGVGGGTITLKGTLKPLEGDNLVSVRSKNLPTKDITEKDITDFIAENKDVINSFGDKVKVGVFPLNETHSSIDINVAIKDKAKALKLANSGKQQSVFDETAVMNDPNSINDGSAFVKTGHDGLSPKALSIQEIEGATGIMADEKKLATALEITRPVLNKKESITAFENAGMKGGIAPKGALGKNTYEPTSYDAEVANSVKNVVSPKKGILDNTVSVNKTINTISENEIKPFLAENKVPFDFGDMRKSLEQITPESSLKSDADAFKTYNRVREEILSDIYAYVKKNVKEDGTNLLDYNVIWDAGKVIDKRIEKELGNAVFGTPQYTGVRASARDLRNGIREFISESLEHPAQMGRLNDIKDITKEMKRRGIDTNKADIEEMKKFMGITRSAEDIAKGKYFSEAMRNLNLMYEARTRLAEQSYKLRLENKIGFQEWIAQNPAKWNSIKWLLGGATTIGALNIAQ